MARKADRQVSGRIVAITDNGAHGGASGGAARFEGYGILLHYAHQTNEGPELIERRENVGEDGSFAFTLTSNAVADPDGRLAVTAPSGETLAVRRLDEIAPRAGGGREDLVIEVRRPSPSFSPSALAAAARAQRAIAGRLLIATGEIGKLAGLPVSLWLEGPDSAARLVWSGQSDKQGYFRALVPAGPHAVAMLKVGAGAAAREIDIVLQDGEVPDPLLVGVDPAVASDLAEECDCDLAIPALPDAAALAVQGNVFTQDLGTGCQSLTRPNRTLEEFDFFRIVRTTDPAIRGTVIADDRQPAAPKTGDWGKIVFDVGTLAQVSGASAIAMHTEAFQTRQVKTGRSSAREDDFIAAETSLRMIEPATLRASGLAEELRARIATDQLSTAGVGTSALWRDAASEKVAVTAMETALAKLPLAVLSAAIEDPDGFTPDKLMTAERRVSAEALRDYLGARAKGTAGRTELNADHRIDWDHTPEFYQATSVAHGHILHLKQEWKADGYSLGDLVKSIPLAPGQQKQIVTLDWSRRDSATRQESTDAREQLTASLSRDRDINEVANAAFRENLSGSSSATTGAVGGGLGLAIGPLVIGGGGGSGWASSSASADSARAFSAETMNSLRDQTSQAVSAVRDQRSTVVNTVSQSENVTAITESIANYNRCHALTIQYFEVLRHFAVQERLAGVSECLFVPLEMGLFDDAKVLRWREILERACPSSTIRRGFDAIERLSNPATTPPNRRYADDPIAELSGRLRFRVSIARPKDPDEASAAVLEQTQWGLLGTIIKVSPYFIYDQFRRNEAQKDRIFQTEIAPQVARAFLDSIDVMLIDRDGIAHPAQFDVTVASRYREGDIMEVTLNDNAIGNRIPRAQIAGVEVRTDYALPDFSSVVLVGAQLGYRTERIAAPLFNSDRVLDDLLPGDPAFMSTSRMTWREERNQLTQDRQARRRLLRHLNDNLEYYHRAIWLGMDRDRRFMLLDGFEAPFSGGRSIASVVENRLIGVLGNCLVMPVAPGFQLDPVLREALAEAGEDGRIDPGEVLLRLYDQPPSPPRRLSVPTRGVFGEAVTGSCNSCETIEEDRFWRWTDFPLPDSPPAIAALSTDSRFAEPARLRPSAFPDALIKYQSIPDAPAPTGMAAALAALGKDVFKDLTGLSENQKNALAALTASMTSAEAFAGEAVSLALARDKAMTLDRTLAQIESAKKSGYLDDAQASAAAKKALMGSIGATPAPAETPATSNDTVAKLVEDAASSPNGKATVSRSDGDTSETVSFETIGEELAIGKAPVTEWIDLPLWVSLPFVADAFPRVAPPAGTRRHDVSEHADFEDARIAALASYPVNSAGDFAVIDPFGRVTDFAGNQPFDFLQAAKDAGLIKPYPADPAKFLTRIDARLCYPAQSSSTGTPKAVHFPHSGKRAMPLAVIVHGNHEALVATGKPKPVTLKNGAAAVTGTLSSIPNHEGYRYLQEHLAAQPEGIISLSISTNLANATGSWVEWRARMINAAIGALKAAIAADPGHFLRDAVDFAKVGLLGHSRGGEAVIRAHQLNLVAKGYTCKAVVSLAPTDFTGATAASKVAVDNPETAYLGIWGGLDGDVSGARRAGGFAFAGAAPRIYDRCKAHKAFVFAPPCTHNRFNNPVWSDHGEWQRTTGGATALDVPAAAASEAAHEALLKEYGWAFFDLILNGNAARQAAFRSGEVKSASGIDVAQQWHFGTGFLTIDDFEGVSASFGARTLDPIMAIASLAPVQTPAAGAATVRDLQVNHATGACIVDVAAATTSLARLAYDLTDAAGNGADLTRYTRLLMRIGQAYDVTGQASIDAMAQPNFVVRMIDGAGTAGELGSAAVYAGWKGPLGRPRHKPMQDPGGGPDINATQIVMHTIAFDTAAMFALPPETSVVNDPRMDIRRLEIDFDTAAATGEIWIDSIELVQL